MIVAHLALLATGLVGDLMRIVVRYQIEHAGDALSATRWIQPLALTLSLLNLVLFALFPLGLLRYHRALRDSGRWLTWLAMVAGFTALLFQLVRDGVHQLFELPPIWVLRGSSLVWQLAELHQLFELPPIWVLRGSSLVWQLAELATYALLLTVVVQGISRLGHRTPRALLVALAISALYCFVYPLLRAIGLPALVKGPILGVAVYATVRSGFSVALILLLLRHRRHLRQLPAPPAGESAPTLDDPGWDLAARGLSTYGGGVLLQIALALLGMLFTLVAARSGNLEQIKGALVVAGVLGLLAAPVVLVGIARYGRVPWESGARPAATAGLLLMLVTLALNLLSLVLVIRATRSPSMWALIWCRRTSRWWRVQSTSWAWREHWPCCAPSPRSPRTSSCPPFGCESHRSAGPYRSSPSSP